MNPTLYKILNAGLSSGGWFACAIGAANGYPWAGPLVVAAAAGLHLWQGTDDWRQEAKYLGLTAVFGFMVDSIQAATGFIHYQGGFIKGLAPLWIVAMWILFAIQLNASLKWVHGRWLLGAALGAWGGITSYFAGEGLGAIEITPNRLTAGIILGATWALIVPALLWLGDRVTGTKTAN